MRVVVADDRPSIRTHLRTLVEAQLDLEVVGTGQSGTAALLLVHELEPDVLVLDQDVEAGPVAVTRCAVIGTQKIARRGVR